MTIFVLLSLYYLEINPGWGGGTIALGIPRVVFGFFAGALIFQYGIHERDSKPWYVFILGVLILIVISGYGGGKLSFVASITLIPIFLVYSCRLRFESGAFLNQFKILGALSFPLYIIHFPIYRLLTLSRDFAQLDAVWKTLLAGSFSILLSLIFAHFDNVIRLRLK